MDTLRICEICKISLSENDVDTHLNGKKHKKKAEQKKRFQSCSAGASAERNKMDVIQPGRPPLAVDGTAPASKTDAQPSSKPVSKTDATPPSKPVSKTVAQPPSKAAKRKANKDLRKLKQMKDVPAEVKFSIPPASVDIKKPFEDQLNDFIAQVCQTENEKYYIRQVLHDVAYTFSGVMPGVIPVLYGSQATGLAFRTSDIDVYLFNPYGHNEEEQENFIAKYGVLIYKTGLFSKVTIIKGAKVPIIKAVHMKTGIELDISATSGQAVANTSLLKFLMSHDSRIEKLMMLIGYCFRKAKLISVSDFKRYSINLLIISYLQNLPEPILPPLHKIVYGIPGMAWPFSFVKDESLLLNSNNTPLFKLFVGFFGYYENFPFHSNIVSTYYGSPISKDDILSPQVMDVMFHYEHYLDCSNKFKLCSPCSTSVQDPFKLDINTTSGVSNATLLRFRQLCHKVVSMANEQKQEALLSEICKKDLASNGLIPRGITLREVVDYPSENFEVVFKQAMHIFDLADGLTICSKKNGSFKYFLETSKIIGPNCGYMPTNQNKFIKKCVPRPIFFQGHIFAKKKKGGFTMLVANEGVSDCYLFCKKLLSMLRGYVSYVGCPSKKEGANSKTRQITGRTEENTNPPVGSEDNTTS